MLTGDSGIGLPGDGGSGGAGWTLDATSGSGNGASTSYPNRAQGQNYGAGGAGFWGFQIEGTAYNASQGVIRIYWVEP